MEYLMKKLIPLFLVFVCLVGCKFNSEKSYPRPTIITKEKTQIENVPPQTIYEHETLDSSVKDGYSDSCSQEYAGKPILTVIPTYKGLKIIKNHPATWTHNTIHVINRTRGYENVKVDNVNETTNEILYPFVKAGEQYEVYIEKQETNEKGDWQDWGEVKSAVVTAVGGLGNCTVVFDKFSYDEKKFLITFGNLKYIKPYSLDVSESYFGPVFQGSVWNSPNTYGINYEKNKSQIKMSGETDFITNQDVVGINLDYQFYYQGFTYKCTMLSQVIYQKGNDKTVKITGGVKIPSVYLTVNGAELKDGTAYHFGENWTEVGKVTIRIEDESDSINNLEETDVLVKDRGNSTKWTPKVPYSLKFTSKTKVLGMPKSKRWVLMANYFDRSLIRTQFAGFLGNNIFNSYWNASFKPVNVYINGMFMGTYDLGECNKVEKNRVNVQSLEDYADKASDYKDVNGDGCIDINDAGFMVEIDSACEWAERLHFYSSQYTIPFTLKDPDFGDTTKYSDEECENYIKYAASKINAFEDMLVKKDFSSKYADYIDATSFADWYIINEFGKNSDANFQKSVPVTYNAATGKLYMGPNWDFDLGFGNFNHGYDLIGGGYNTVDNPTGWYIWGGKKGCDENAHYVEANGPYVQSWWINRLMESSSFKKIVKDRWKSKRTMFKNAINKEIVEYANRIADYIPQNEARLPRLGQYEWNGPSGYSDRTEYGDEVYYMYNWCMERFNWMDSQISQW